MTVDRRTVDLDAGGREWTTIVAAAVDYVVHTQHGSANMLHRTLGISLARAAAIMRHLEANGVVGPIPSHGTTRNVLVRAERLDEVLTSLGLTEQEDTR